MKSSIKKLLEKLKNVNWKSKKSIIAYAVIFTILVAGTGTGLALKHFNNSSDIVKTDVKDKTTSKPADDKKEDEKSDDKKDTDKKDENSKPTDKTDDKKQETSKTDDKKTNSSSTNKNQNTPVNNNNSNSNNNTGNSSNNDNNTTPTPPTNNGGGNSGINITPTPQPPAHTHNWVEVYETINHPEQGHNEQVPRYEGRWAHICKICGKDVTGFASEHNEEHMLAGETGPNNEGGWKTEWIEEIVGYDDVWVVDVPAWPEQVLKGYTCSCGATK